MPTTALPERPQVMGKYAEISGSHSLSDASQSVVMDAQAEVTDFLSSRPLLAAMLNEALSEKGRFFGPHLRVFADAIENEDTGEAAELYIAIETHLDVENAMQSLDAFCNDWLYKKPQSTWQGLIFDVKFP